MVLEDLLYHKKIIFGIGKEIFVLIGKNEFKTVDLVKIQKFDDMP